jgi:hypothetical protein
MSKARIANVIWAVPGVADGEEKTLEAALREVQRVRKRVGMIRAYVVVRRRDGTRERLEV